LYSHFDCHTYRCNDIRRAAADVFGEINYKKVNEEITVTNTTACEDGKVGAPTMP